MKKRLLFVIESLSVGGAEKSLVTLLNLIDYSKYSVDLLLFAKGGAFQELLPNEVNLLQVPDYFKYSSESWSNILYKLKYPDKMISQLRYSIGLRFKKSTHIEKSVMLWKACSKCTAAMSENYDVAIAYAQGLPTFFVADKVTAKKKIAWINVTYLPTGKSLDFIKPYYDKYDMVNAVSESVREQMQDTFGIPDEKVMVMKDILDTNFAHKMSEMKSNVSRDMDYDGLKILTVGRLAKMKGHDLAVEATKNLVDRGLDFKWYAVGEGPMRDNIEKKIREYHLEKYFILLGSRNNPYPYFSACDLYVQTSRFEGFGITLAEAKMFGKPVVTTNFDAVNAQIISGKNGLIVDMDAKAIADGILKMNTDQELRETCVRNLSIEKIGNYEEIEKLYSAIDN